MNSLELNDKLTFTIDIKYYYIEIAKKLSQNKLTSAKAKEFYYHILGICAVKDYLELLGYQTDWNSSNFHDPVNLTFNDVADLEVKNHGKIECRAVCPDKDIFIPPDAWSNRIGYLFVEIDESLPKATLLGFISSREETEGIVNLDQLCSLEDFPEYLAEKEESYSAKQSWGESVQEGVVILKQWFRDTKDSVESQWNNIEDSLIVQSQSRERPSNTGENVTSIKDLLKKEIYRGWEPLLVLSTIKTSRKKEIFLGKDLLQLQLHISQQDNGITFINLWVVKEGNLLPKGLEVIIPDELELFRQTVTEDTNLIQIPLEFESSEMFWIELRLGEESIREYFKV